MEDIGIYIVGAFTDKSEWGEGPWQHEPDKVQWKDEATGYPCLAVRGPSGALCGYVGVPEGHPYYGIGTYGAHDADGNETGPNPDAAIRVHGGLTYAEHCQKDDPERGVCHVPAPGEPDNVWWFGFDCAHSFDFLPGFAAEFARAGKLAAQLAGSPANYRTLGYVKTEVGSLALQLKAVAA